MWDPQVVTAPEDMRIVRRRLRVLRLLGLALCVVAFVLFVPAVDMGTPSRGDAYAAMLRLLFVPLGEVTQPALLWSSRVLFVLGLVLIAKSEFIRSRMNRERRRLRRSGDPSVRTGRR